MANDAYTFVEQIVIDDTQRPDLAQASVGVVKRRIQRAVQSLHRIDFFQKDFVEQKVGFQTESAIQSLDVINMLPRLRALGYVRKWSQSLEDLYSSTGTALTATGADFFKEINPQYALDGYGYDKRNVMYRSGMSIKFNSSEAFQFMFVGWFRDPNISDIENCESWILSDYPNLVASHVKARIFKDIGKEEESRSANREYEMEYNIFVTNNIKLAVLQQ